MERVYQIRIKFWQIVRSWSNLSDLDMITDGVPDKYVSKGVCLILIDECGYLKSIDYDFSDYA